MDDARTVDIQLVHVLPGRVRVHLPEWGDRAPRHLESRLLSIPGIRRAHFNPLTANLLVHFDPARFSPSAVVDLLRGLHPTGETMALAASALPVSHAGRSIAARSGRGANAGRVIQRAHSRARISAIAPTFAGVVAHHLAPRAVPTIQPVAIAHVSSALSRRIHPASRSAVLPVAPPSRAARSGRVALMLGRSALALADVAGSLTVADIIGLLTDFRLTPLLLRAALGPQRTPVVLRGAHVVSLALDRPDTRQQALRLLIALVKLCLV